MLRLPQFCSRWWPYTPPFEGVVERRGSTRVEFTHKSGERISCAYRVSRSIAQSEPSRTSANLLSAENGGRLLLAPGDAWTVTVDGKEEQYREVQVGEEAVFGFKDERRATFDTFGMLIPQERAQPKRVRTAGRR